MSHPNIQPIPRSMGHQWTIVIDGHERQISHFVGSHPDFGTLKWGLRPEGTVGWSWAEISGGGIAIVPHTIYNEKLYIGVLDEARANMPGGTTLNIPRGFRKITEREEASAIREFFEETGLSAENMELLRLPGDPVNFNSTFFDTSDGGGVVFFSLFVSSTLVVSSSDELHLDKKYFCPRNSLGEKITRLVFIDPKKALHLPDMFTVAAVARFLAWHNSFS